MPDLIGATLGQYQIVREIGRGGMAIVYEAYQPALNRRVALKALLPHFSADPVFVQRFLHEARAAACLEHPNIVPIYDVGEQDGRYFIVMRLLPGESLKALIERTGRLPLERTTRILAQIAAAVDYAHAQGFVHRDIKPGNILIGPGDHAVLTDFGIAKAVEGTQLTLSGTLVGTPAYMSPEQARGAPVGPASDRYSLGVTLFEMLAGRVPFKADSTPALLHQHVYEPPPPLRSFAPDLADAIEPAMAKALAKDPTARYSSAGEMVAAMEKVQRMAADKRMAQRAGEQRSGGAEGRRSRGTAGLPTVIVGVAIALLAVILLVVGVLVANALRAAPTRVVVVTATPEPTRVVATPTKTPEPAKAPTVAPPTKAPTAILPTPAPEPTKAPTVAPPTKAPEPTKAPTLGIGSPQVSDKDGMTLLYVPAGEFLMGSADGDSDAYSDEKPQHKVTLDAFWIDRTEVTNAMFAKFVAAARYKTDAEKAGKARAFDPTSKQWAETAGADWQHPRGPGSDIAGLEQHPVAQVSWNDATAYCAWAGRRLPTEAEWEKAARGTDGRKFPWGNQNVAGDLLNFADRNLDVSWADKSINDGYQFTAPVGSYPKGASPYGALDMAGNVWEWVADWYNETYDQNVPAQNPKGPDSGQYRVLRGGSWNDGQRLVRAADRNWNYPETRFDDLGFRCARSP